MKIALVHDWLIGTRGGEAVLEALCELYPQADIHTLIHKPGSVSKTIEQHRIHTSPLQSMPGGITHYHKYLPLLPIFAEGWELSDYDVVISTSHAVAKNAKASQEALHISYIFSPIRYFWDMFDEYFDQRFGELPRLSYKVLNQVVKFGVGPWRWWDAYTANRTDEFLVLSHFVQKRIKNYYGRESRVIYPPVDVDTFIVREPVVKEDYYIIVTALVPYKRVDLAVEAFNQNKKKLVVVGKGTEMKRLRTMASKNIELRGYLERDEMTKLLQKARGFIYPQIEDFGITAVEAQAAGTPVIAYGVGGATETVINGQTGTFFDQQTPRSLNLALDRFEKQSFDLADLIRNARRFSKERFKMEIASFVSTHHSQDK